MQLTATLKAAAKAPPRLGSRPAWCHADPPRRRHCAALSGKAPGARDSPGTVEMQFNYQNTFAAPAPDACETLLWDVMKNDATLFKRAEQVMLPLEELQRIDSDTELWVALQKMDRDGVNQLPVTRDHHVIGMLSREDVITFLRTLKELGT